MATSITQFRKYEENPKKISLRFQSETRNVGLAFRMMLLNPSLNAIRHALD